MSYLFLSAHTDDAEFAAGGTIARMAEEGHDVHVVAFSYCGNTKLKQEMEKACKHLGASRVIILNYEVRNFNKDRQGVLDNMIALRNQIKPHTVFTFSASDTHQDHSVIHDESIRAFKHCNLFGYNFPHNNIGASLSNTFVKLSGEHVNKKVQALSYYKSQKARAYMSDDYTISSLICNGVICGHAYAEAFNTIRKIV